MFGRPDIVSTPTAPRIGAAPALPPRHTIADSLVHRVVAVLLPPIRPPPLAGPRPRSCPTIVTDIDPVAAALRSPAPTPTSKLTALSLLPICTPTLPTIHPELPAPRAVPLMSALVLAAMLDDDCHAVVSVLDPLTRACAVVLALPVPRPTTVTLMLPVLATLARTAPDSSGAS